jgi:hypothetical protein
MESREINVERVKEIKVEIIEGEETKRGRQGVRE